MCTELFILKSEHKTAGYPSSTHQHRKTNDRGGGTELEVREKRSERNLWKTNRRPEVQVIRKRTTRTEHLLAISLKNGKGNGGLYVGHSGSSCYRFREVTVISAR